MSQGSRMLGPPGGPTLTEPGNGSPVDTDAVGSPLDDPVEEGPPLASGRDDLASPARPV